jgi:hypothetical protein
MTANDEIEAAYLYGIKLHKLLSSDENSYINSPFVMIVHLLPSSACVRRYFYPQLAYASLRQEFQTFHEQCDSATAIS